LEQAIRTGSGIPLDSLALARAILRQRRLALRRGIGAALSLLLVFPPIALAAYLTGGRGLASFRAVDWRIFTAMVITVLLGFVLFFLLLRGYIRASAEYRRLLDALLGVEPEAENI
jgi:hypothetical protein